MGNRGEQIGRWVGDQGAHGRQVRAERVYRPVPGGVVGRGVPTRPVAVRPGRRDVPRVAAELQDVPLGDAQMFQEPPGAVGHRRDRAPAEDGWNVGHGPVEGEVGAAAPEEVEEVFAEGLVRFGSHPGVSVWNSSVSAAECGRTNRELSGAPHNQVVTMINRRKLMNKLPANGTAWRASVPSTDALKTTSATCFGRAHRCTFAS